MRNSYTDQLTRRRRTCQTAFPGPDGYTIPDLLGRRFDPGAPDVAWVQDITYIPTGEGWLYLASVLDLGSRRLLGYSMADHMRTSLVLDALEMAVAARGGDTAVGGVICHADRGTQYTANDYIDFCHDRQMRPSAGRTAVCGTPSTPCPSRSGSRSNANVSKAGCSRPGPRPEPRSISELTPSGLAPTM